MVKLIFSFLITWIPVFLLSIDSFGNNNKVAIYFGIPSALFVLVGWLMLSILKFLKKKVFDKKIYWVPLLVWLVASLVSTAVISIWDFISEPNYVYSVTKLHQEQMGIITVYVLGSLLITRSLGWWKRNYRKVFGWLSFGILVSLIIVRLWPFDYFFNLIKEDHFIEISQSAIMLIGSLIISYLTLKTASLNSVIKLGLLVLIITAFVFVAGEEISWGQRIFNIETPENMSRINLQNEITVHNISSVQWLVEFAYLSIGLLGGFLWLIPKTIRNNFSIMHLFIPPTYLFGFFIIPGIYYAYPFYSRENLLHNWAEVMELLLYTGIVCHVIYISYFYLTPGKKGQEE